MTSTLFLEIPVMTRGVVQVIEAFLMSIGEMGGLLLGIAPMAGVAPGAVRYSLFIFIVWF